MSVAIIINPVSGGIASSEVRRRVRDWRRRCSRRCANRGEVFVTERRGHARELAAAAVARGARLVVAWGGDGTVNEVASASCGGDAALGIVPAGSGNGLARELGVARRPDARDSRGGPCRAARRSTPASWAADLRQRRRRRLRCARRRLFRSRPGGTARPVHLRADHGARAVALPCGDLSHRRRAARPPRAARHVRQLGAVRQRRAHRARGAARRRAAGPGGVRGVVAVRDGLAVPRLFNGGVGRLRGVSTEQIERATVRPSDR